MSVLQPFVVPHSAIENQAITGDCITSLSIYHPRHILLRRNNLLFCVFFLLLDSNMFAIKMQVR